VTILEGTPDWYWLITIGISAYHAYRGCRYYRLVVARRPEIRSWPRCDKIVVLYIQAVFLYGVCSLAGFVALCAACRLSALHLAGHSVTGAVVGLIGFLYLFGFVGAVGELPHLIQAGKFPK
jgi:hypothetical protein